MTKLNKWLLVHYVIGIGLLIFCMFFLSECELESDVIASPTIGSVDIEYSEFDLIVDRKTDIVYIDNTITTYDDDGWKKYSHVYTPYYSRNGKLCRFVDGKVEEIE